MSRFSRCWTNGFRDDVDGFDPDEGLAAFSHDPLVWAKWRVIRGFFARQVCTFADRTALLAKSRQLSTAGPSGQGGIFLGAELPPPIQTLPGQRHTVAQQLPRHRRIR